jgi:hypothetical protein
MSETHSTPPAQPEATTNPPSDKPQSAEAAAGRQQQHVQVQVKDDEVVATYANFCRVTGSPEELIIDFGLNPQPLGVPKDPIRVQQRIVVNFFTAKRLLAALQMSIARHESVFGVLETDIQKRVRPQGQGQQQQQQQQQGR